MGSSCCRGRSHLSPPARESPPGSFPSSRFHRERRGFGSASVPCPGPAGGNQLRLLLTAWENIQGSSSPERPEIQAAAALVPPPSFSCSFSISLFSPQPHGPRGKSRTRPRFPWGQQVTAGHPSHPGHPPHPLPGARLIPHLLSLKNQPVPSPPHYFGHSNPNRSKILPKVTPSFSSSLCLLREYFSSSQTQNLQEEPPSQR